MTKRDFVISVITIISLVLILSSLNHVAEGNRNESNVRIPSLKQIGNLISSVPGLIADFINSFNFKTKDFINSAKQISGDFIKDGYDLVLTIDRNTPSRIWGKVDDWFVDLTGLHIADVLRGVSHAIVWFLEFVLRLFKWLLSLFESP